MAKKIEIIGQALIITDTTTGTVVFDAPKAEYYYDVKLLQRGKISLHNLDYVDNAIARLPIMNLSDVIDETDTPFTVNSFQTFARENLGFKTASGGSGADQEPQTLPTSSTIVSSRDMLATDADGLNDSTSGTNITITIVNDSSVDLPVGTLIIYKQSGSGNVIVSAGSGVTLPTYQTYNVDDTITIRKIGANTWECLNPPKPLTSSTDGEPTGSGIVRNIVFLTQAEYDAGTPNSTTLYIILD